MVIHEFGTENEKHLLFFQGSCEPWQEFASAAKCLSEQFHVMLVTPDGHDPDEHTDFISVEKTVDDAALWLRSHRIDRAEALYGMSFGGGMVIRLLTVQSVPVRKAIIDAGTAPYRFPKWICRLICVRDYMMVKIGTGSIRAMKAAFPPERFAHDPEHADEEYREIRRYLKTYSDKTFWNVFWSANNYAVPDKPPTLDTQIQFWVGEDEWKGRFRDLRWTEAYLKQIEVVKIPHMMHGELVMMHPDAFAERALAFFTE